MKLKQARYFLIAMFIMVVTIVSGCGAKPNNDTTNESNSNDSGSQKQLKFGMVIKDPSAPYEQAFIHAAQDKAKELGVIIDIKDGQADSLKIMNLMDTYIDQKVDGFIMAGAVDLKAIVPGIQKLNAAGIPIMALDTSPEGGKVDLFLSFDIEDSSRKAAKLFVQGIKNRNGGNVPDGVVIEIMGSVQDMFAQACTKGFRSVIDQYPQLKVAQGDGKWNNVDANARTSDLLTRYGQKVLGIYVHTPDIMAPGVVSAIEAAGLNPKDYGICGICIGPEGMDLIEKGKILAVVEQPAYDSAALAVQYLYDECNGKPIPKIGDTVMADGEIWSPAEVIKNPWVDEGAYMKLKGPIVPNEVRPDDPRLWENKLKDLWTKNN
ncbi:monosaccharide ABC transporter substrate-binding protein, CUT2 family (TC 3.A.1.2.-) [Desulfotomaculum arcticum]|uniref:Monosaccharide ABC transporter substrate-binding protein, CUT2 family (TC 3.A.1.2.-) n=1 Tax=Desulfotruncus arcticus DSM 17038 TaxID=1121424 RepID=A0A1I2ZQ61_9FIRM|nr:sugar ABC transporter substrate-binding protein [Desulfotruncus arcticus]SFH39977.1 monosaccharide ABC transporter substrate-binding protein, CUT2 family (TC 3.A.1.2.-) [Desulfotomaculum arcticum] [Desulfotruncus arcticus DSM 17038]